MFAIRARVYCSAALKLAVAAGDIGGQVIAGLTEPALQFVESYHLISAFSFADDRHFLIIFPLTSGVSPDLIGCRPTFEPIIIILSCSSNMAAA